ncbi:MAG: diguanylate cyclase [Comamonadaceae bacterium]|nr:MAG: diguanylate cyclase [Comamonadaceae bacterium]
MRRVLPAVCALLLLIGLGGYLLVANALRQDADVQQRSRTFIARSIEQVRNEIGRNIINYSKWGEAYKNLHMRVNKVWADDQRNVGDIPFALYGYDGVLVVGPQGRTVYAVIQGKPSAMQASDWIDGDLDGLLAAARDARNEDTSVVRALKVKGTPALVAAATLTPGWDPAIERTPGAASVMVFVTLLDAHRLAVLSDSYGMPPLTLSAHPPPQGIESMPLLESATQLHWRAPTPGRALLAQTLPIFIAGVLALAGVLFVLLRHALASARQIDAQIDALHATQAGLTHSEQRFRDIAEASSDWLWEVDAQGRLTYLSERFTQVTGAPRAHWLGRPLADLLEPPATTPLPDWLAQATHGGQARDTLRCHYRDQAGRQRVCKITARAVADGAGHRGTATDITDEVQAQARVLHLSLHDSLTDLPNRLQLQQFLARHLGVPPQPLALLCLDLDRFKPVNDAWGHAFGDLLLQQVAQRLRTQTPPGGLAARLGGDEFVVVLPGAVDLPAIEQVCAQLVQALAQPFTLQAHAIHIGTSIGIALAPAHAQDPAELLRKADIALYQAKDAGRSTWCLYDSSMQAHLPRP